MPVTVAPAFPRTALLWALLAAPLAPAGGRAIDRHALVARHNPTLQALDPWSPLTVGNGSFAFTADVTGLQTFGERYRAEGIGLETLARWAWHEDPNPENFTLDQANTPFASPGGEVAYPTQAGSPAGRWLRENPHDLPLGELALVEGNGTPLDPRDVTGIDQQLDLWRGEIRSLFHWRGELVAVSTVADPDQSGLAVRIISPALGAGRLAVRLRFPRGHDTRIKNNPPLDWGNPDSYTSTYAAQGDTAGAWTWRRDAAAYFARLEWSPGAALRAASPHEFRIAGPPGAGRLDLVLAYAPGAPLPALASVPRIQDAAARHWQAFWQSGGAVDFSGSTDPRAAELERRVVLSQYLLAAQFAGDVPPQESGLTLSTWYGKHNTEMVWWHLAHFALWGRDAAVERALGWYQQTLPAARKLAAARGLRGARWAKMVGPDGRESPGGNPLIIWNQPHPIALAELLYRNRPTPETLARYRDLVLATADGLAAMTSWNRTRQCFELGPPLWIAQEIYDQATSVDPTFELSYWGYALTVAQEWRRRLGLPPDAVWENIRTHLAPLPVREGRYVALESHPDTWENRASRQDHPSFLMAAGMLPGYGVDRPTMQRTLAATLEQWDWEAKIWGWDYPMIAMTAARLGDPARAVDTLLSPGPNNQYVGNGHCPQRGDLPVYLPANGALLAAVALMAGGWDGAPAGGAPGFPRDGRWQVHAEGLHPLP